MTNSAATESLADRTWEDVHDVLVRAARGEVLSETERALLTDIDLQVRRIRKSNSEMREVLKHLRHAKIVHLDAGDILVLENPYPTLHKALDLASIVE